MAGVGTGDAVSEVAFDLGQGGVTEPVGGDALGGDPGQLVAQACPEVVVAAAGHGTPVAETQERIGGQGRAVVGGMVGEAVCEGRANGLPADGVAFLPELDQALFGVEIGQP